MKTLYQAASVVEAHMLRDLLWREGIVAHIHGEHLQGAMGELPAAGLIRLVVDEPDFDRARVLVDQWDAEQPAHTPAPPPAPQSRLVFVFLIGLALGVAGTAAFFRSAATVDATCDASLAAACCPPANP
jgi:Putative prokaryotic signal transducing protein